MADDHLDVAAITAHDRQRRLPIDAQRALVDGLYARLHGRGPCLDAGVGTGSVALPLVAAGITVVGVDRSGAMLDALRARAGGTAPLPLVRGDLLQLPFRTAAFGAALAANVFHLIPTWRTAVTELVRVVDPGGLLLVNLGSGGGGTRWGALVQEAFRERLGEAWPANGRPSGPRDADDFEACLAAHGATSQPPIEVEIWDTTTIEETIARLEHNVFARPRDVDPGALRHAAAATRGWARTRLGALDAPHPRERLVTYRVYRLRS